MIKDLVLLILKYLMNRQVGFTRKILEILEDYNISFDHMPSGIDSISIILRTYQLKGKEKMYLTLYVNVAMLMN